MELNGYVVNRLLSLTFLHKAFDVVALVNQTGSSSLQFIIRNDSNFYEEIKLLEHFSTRVTLLPR